MPLILLFVIPSGSVSVPSPAAPSIHTCADQVASYLPYLRGKRVGMRVNQASINGKALSVDSLLALGVDIRTIFGPEHGLAGQCQKWCQCRR